MNEIKLYEQDLIKPPLDDLVLEHFGVKGMRWGHRKDGKPQGYQGSGKGRKKGSTSKSKPKSSKKNWKTKSKEEIIASKDLKAMNKRKNEFSDQEINQVLNRINTEQRLSQTYKNNTVYGKIKKTINSPEFKVIAAVSLVALPVMVQAVKYNKSQKSYTDYMNSVYSRKFIEDKSNPVIVPTRGTKPNYEAVAKALKGIMYQKVGLANPGKKK